MTKLHVLNQSPLNCSLCDLNLTLQLIWSHLCPSVNKSLADWWFLGWAGWNEVPGCFTMFPSNDTNQTELNWEADALWNLWGLYTSTTCLSIRLSSIANPSLGAPHLLCFPSFCFLILFQRHSCSFSSPALNMNYLMRVNPREFPGLLRIPAVPLSTTLTAPS